MESSRVRALYKVELRGLLLVCAVGSLSQPLSTCGLFQPNRQLGKMWMSFLGSESDTGCPRAKKVSFSGTSKDVALKLQQY